MEFKLNIAGSHNGGDGIAPDARNELFAMFVLSVSLSFLSLYVSLVYNSLIRCCSPILSLRFRFVYIDNGGSESNGAEV